MNLVQLQRSDERRLAAVEEPNLRLIEGHSTLYALARTCLICRRTARGEIEHHLGKTLDYEEVYQGRSEWKLLPPVDHPEEPARCLISGTGLTHMASAKNRQAMHGREEELTDSLRMYRWGVEGGKPSSGTVGVAPEWFYKGNGTILRAHGASLIIPAYAEDGGEEPEIAAVYVIDDTGTPRRLGFAQGNEFSDHELERRNYLYLAASKLRTCALGPELALAPDFESIAGEVLIERNGQVLWRKQIRSGESVMSHSLENIEHHHFKFEAHRRPGDVHIHFLGADAFSFGEGIRLQDGDIMQVHFDGMGRPLRNPIDRVAPNGKMVLVTSWEETT